MSDRIILPPVPTEGAPTLGLVDGDGLITAKRRTRGFCQRHRFIINEDDRTVQCKACSKMFDAIEALIYLASWPDRYRDEVTHLNREIKTKTAVLDDLERRVRNTRATARRRGVKIPGPWDVPRGDDGDDDEDPPPQVESGAR